MRSSSELELTKSRFTTVWWALAWRQAVFGGLSGIIGTLVGGLLGGLYAAANAGRPDLTPDDISAFAAGVGIPMYVVIALWLSIFPVRMVLRKNFGDFRVGLLAPTGVLPQPRPDRTAGRYQVQQAGPSMVKLDTTTGESWLLVDQDWVRIEGAEGQTISGEPLAPQQMPLSPQGGP